MSQTQENAIREWLARFQVQPVNSSVTIRMRPDTAQLVKKREAPPHQLWYVTCEGEIGDESGRYWEWTVLATEEESGRWSASGVAGASGGCPERGLPWVNLGGSWGPPGFRAGGTVEDAGAGIARVRLTDAQGLIFEDTVDDGVVLFISDRSVATPLRVDLLDADGRVVRSDEWG
jgi:hypothetical protein